MALVHLFILVNLWVPVNRSPKDGCRLEGKYQNPDIRAHILSGNATSGLCNHMATEEAGYLFARTGFIEPSILTERENINWRSRRKLNWNDFKGNPIANAPNAALTSTSILINFGYDDKSLSYTLKCVFYPQKSWTKVSSAHILAHEQGHFDISQLFTRKLHKALSEYRFSAGNVDRDVQKIYNKISGDQADFQQLYDNETNYSRDTELQKKWQERIEGELADLVEFSQYPQ